ncbi:MAG: helix-hairpin-helix domain-containing protein [Desulfobacterales bacterium]|jgi:DNA-directed RNA polymerase alpha subunit
MKMDDLTQVKNIGSARMKLLNSQGITTIQQLYEMPLEKLEQMKSLGKHYAKLIKESVTDFYGEKAESPEKQATVGSPRQGEKTNKTDRNLNAELAKTAKYLKTAKEKLKPIQKKKHLKLFVDLKKRANRLKISIRALDQIQPDISKKQKKKIIKKATSLNTLLKNVKKNKKGKTMKALLKEIQSFSKLINQTYQIRG